MNRIQFLQLMCNVCRGVEEFRAELLMLLILLLLNTFSIVLPTVQESSGLVHLHIGRCILSAPWQICVIGFEDLITIQENVVSILYSLKTVDLHCTRQYSYSILTDRVTSFYINTPTKFHSLTTVNFKILKPNKIQHQPT